MPAKHFSIKVGCIGECVQDLFVTAPARIASMTRQKVAVPHLCYEYGSKIPMTSMNFDFGGCAANAATSMSRQNISTVFYGAIGNKDFFIKAKKEFVRNGVNTRYLMKGTVQQQGLSLILVGPDADRTILMYRERNPFNADHLKDFLNTVDCVYIGDINAATDVSMDLVMRYHAQKRLRIFLNPSNFQLQTKYRMRLKKLLRCCEILAVNDDEARRILGQKKIGDPVVTLQQLRRLGPKIVIVTKGPEGAYVYDGGVIYRAGIWDAPVVDRTGSGDAFFSTFVASILSGMDISRAIVRATINAGHVVSQYGAQSGLLPLGKINALEKKHRISIKQI